MEKFILASASYSNKRIINITLSGGSLFSKEEIRLIKQAHDEYQKLFAQTRVDLDKASDASVKHMINNKFRSEIHKVISKELNLSYFRCYSLWSKAEFVIPCVDKDEFLVGKEA